MEGFYGTLVLVVLSRGSVAESWGNGATSRPLTMTTTPGDLYIYDTRETLADSGLVTAISFYLTGSPATIRLLLLDQAPHEEGLSDLRNRVITTSDDIEVSGSGEMTYLVSTPLLFFDWYKVGIYVVDGYDFPIAYSDNNDSCTQFYAVRTTNLSNPPVATNTVFMDYLDIEGCLTFSYEVSYVRESECIHRELDHGQAVAITSPFYYDNRDYNRNTEICWEVLTDDSSKLSVNIHQLDLTFKNLESGDSLSLVSGGWEKTLRETSYNAVYCPSESHVTMEFLADITGSGTGFVITVSSGDECHSTIPLLSVEEIASIVAVPTVCMLIVVLCLYWNGCIKCTKNKNLAYAEQPNTTVNVAQPSTSVPGQTHNTQPKPTLANTERPTPSAPPGKYLPLLRPTALLDPVYPPASAQGPGQPTIHHVVPVPPYVQPSLPPVGGVTPAGPDAPPSYQEAMRLVHHHMNSDQNSE